MNEEIRDSKHRLVQDATAVIAEAEALLRAVKDEGSDKVKALRSSLEARVQVARERLAPIQEAAAAQARIAAERARAAAQATDHYVHESPWQAVAVAAGIGAVVGLCAAMMFSGRDE